MRTKGSIHLSPIAVIHSESDPSEWRYVNRESNPADDGSKGVKLDALIANDRWLKGPGFLWKDQTHWPRTERVLVLQNDDPAVRKDVQVYFATARCNVLETLILHHSSWWKLKYSVAWLLHCKKCLLNRVRLKKIASVENKTRSEQWIHLGELQ